MKELKIDIPEGYEIDKENSTFECIKFKKKKNNLPESWEEYLEKHVAFPTLIKCNVEILSKNLGQKYAALHKLELLRNCWRQGWEPIWGNDKRNYGIYTSDEKVVNCCLCCGHHKFLSFDSIEKTEKFIKCFYDLIIQAKDLI